MRRDHEAGSQRVAVDDGASLTYLLTDHLGSVVATLNTSGTLLSETRYMPFGGVRDTVGTIDETDFGYTGQRDNSYIKLLDYGARWYSADLARFTQPDSISRSRSSINLEPLVLRKQ